MAARINFRLKGTAVASTGVTHTSERQRPARHDDAPLSGRAAAVVDCAVSAWANLLGMRLDPREVFASMERIRSWTTRPMRKSSH
ncbi:MAG: hypothetical protein LUO89_06385 [Methanothrix sp.]|nr:hypothetical protein [Methanothrix sp.]